MRIPKVFCTLPKKIKDEPELAGLHTLPLCYFVANKRIGGGKNAEMYSQAQSIAHLTTSYISVANKSAKLK